MIVAVLIALLLGTLIGYGCGYGIARDKYRPRRRIVMQEYGLPRRPNVPDSGYETRSGRWPHSRP